jgi:hypothetical protein
MATNESAWAEAHPTRLAATVLWLGVVAGGCSGLGTYASNRGHDALDVVTLSFPFGAGVMAQAGPVGTGLGVLANDYGLRFGEFGYFDQSYDVHFLFAGSGCGSAPGPDPWRRKGYTYDQLFGLIMPGLNSSMFRTPAPGQKGIVWAQVEGAAALGVGVRAGVNVAELVDFVLGFATIDIMDDDQKPPTDPNAPAPRAKTNKERISMG